MQDNFRGDKNMWHFSIAKTCSKNSTDWVAIICQVGPQLSTTCKWFIKNKVTTKLVNQQVNRNHLYFLCTVAHREEFFK